MLVQIYPLVVSLRITPSLMLASKNVVCTWWHHQSSFWAKSYTTPHSPDHWNMLRPLNLKYAEIFFGFFVSLFWLILLSLNSKKGKFPYSSKLFCFYFYDFGSQFIDFSISGCSFIPSTPSWGFLSINYCMIAAWHRDSQPAAQLTWCWSPGCFDSSPQLVCISGSGVFPTQFLITQI